jgi:hypothetical protein
VPSDFAAAFADAAANLDNTFGEPIELQPMLPGDFSAGVVDPANPFFSVIGILDAPDKVTRVEGAAAISGNASDLVAAAPSADFAASLFPSAGPMPAVGWRIQATTRATRNLFKIVGVKFDGVSRIVCQLEEIPT